MGITLARKRLVEAITDPKVNTKREAAKRAGITEQATYVALRDPNVAKEIAKREAKLRDKAKGEVAASQRLRKLVSKRLASLNIDDLDALETVAVVHKTLQIHELELAIRAKYPDLESAKDGLSTLKAYTDRCVRIGRYLESRSCRATPIECR